MSNRSGRAMRRTHQGNAVDAIAQDLRASEEKEEENAREAAAMLGPAVPDHWYRDATTSRKREAQYEKRFHLPAGPRWTWDSWGPAPPYRYVLDHVA